MNLVYNSYAKISSWKKKEFFSYHTVKNIHFKKYLISITCSVLKSNIKYTTG